MTTPGHPPPSDLVAASLLRMTADTRAARHFRALVDESGGRVILNEAASPERLLEQLAGRFESAAHPRRVAIREARGRAREALAQAERSRIRWLSQAQPDYPDRLWQIPDPPIVLWVRGVFDVLTAPAVAVVGARQATPAGLALATRLARELAEAGLVVVSGMARGIDGAAHEGALEGGGRTVAVLGCGADVIYPAEHSGLAARISETGAVISEFPPGAEPLPWRFPLRNRIISGLVRAVVVIEASDRSGSLITARAALEQGRDVLAVPGSVASGRYRGGHALIKDGARLVETVDDVLEEIGWPRQPVSRSADAGNTCQISWLEQLMATGEPHTVDDLVRLTGRPVSDLLAELACLEVSGRVVRSGGGNFTKT